MVLAFHQRARQRPYRPLFRKRVERVCNLDCWNIPVKFTMLMAAKACVMSHIESWSAGISFAVSQASKVAVLPQQTISIGGSPRLAAHFNTRSLETILLGSPCWH